MAELFGAPVGIIAKEAGNRAEAGFGLDALETMGKLAQQPVELEHKAALSRLYRAQAGKAEQEAEGEAALLKVQTEFLEQEARQELGQAAHAQGRELTAKDIAPEGAAAMLARKPSQADALEKLSAFAKAKKVSPLALAKIDDQIAKIRGSEATAEWREAQAEHMRFLEDSKRREHLGATAASMAASPQNFVLGMMDPAIRKQLPKELPVNYAAAKPFLEMIAQSSLTAQQQAAEQRNKQELELKESRARASNAASGAAAGAATARRDLARERLTVLKKHGGATAEATIDAKRAAAEASRARAAAVDQRNFPPAPLDPKAWSADERYTAPDGRKFIARVNPATGRMAMQFLDTAKAPAKRAVAPAGVDDDDDLED